MSTITKFFEIEINNGSEWTKCNGAFREVEVAEDVASTIDQNTRLIEVLATDNLDGQWIFDTRVIHKSPVMEWSFTDHDEFSHEWDDTRYYNESSRDY